jgi:hypothetical protein
MSDSRTRLPSRQNLDAVPPGIIGEEASHPIEIVVPENLRAVVLQTPSQFIQGARLDQDRRVRLARRHEPLLHTDVKLLSAEAEPDPSPRPKRLGLRYLVQPQQPTEEPSRLILTAGGRSQLDVIDPEYAHPRPPPAQAR